MCTTSCRRFWTVSIVCRHRDDLWNSGGNGGPCISPTLAIRCPDFHHVWRFCRGYVRFCSLQLNDAVFRCLVSIERRNPSPTLNWPGQDCGFRLIWPPGFKAVVVPLFLVANSLPRSSMDVGYAALSLSAVVPAGLWFSPNTAHISCVEGSMWVKRISDVHESNPACPTSGSSMSHNTPSGANRLPVLLSMRFGRVRTISNHAVGLSDGVFALIVPRCRGNACRHADAEPFCAAS